MTIFSQHHVRVEKILRLLVSRLEGLILPGQLLARPP
jgi:hypothetical protein